MPNVACPADRRNERFAQGLSHAQAHARSARRACARFSRANTRIASPSTTSRWRSSPASSSVTSVPTAPASPRRSRCSPASSCRRSGQVRVAGLVPWKQRKENARNIGVVFGQRSQLYWDLPLIESFELLRAIYGIPARSVPAQPRRVRRDSRDGRLHADAGAPALAGPAHARRLRRRAAARPEDRLSRRAHDRSRRRRKGGHPRVHRANQCRARARRSF